jgi:hypothetical protein
MPKKNSMINNTIPDEKILIADEIPEVETPQIITKPKRQISDAQREHLNNIRAKALQKKAEMKEETLKAKLAKTIEKKELVKKYDDYILNKPPIQKENIKPIEKEKKEKKIIYKYASSSSSSSDEDNESEKIVYVKKCKKRNNKNKEIKYNKPEVNTLDSTLYKSSQEILHSRAIEERVKANLIRWNNAMMPQEY